MLEVHYHKLGGTISVGSSTVLRIELKVYEQFTRDLSARSYDVKSGGRDKYGDALLGGLSRGPKWGKFEERLPM